MALAGEGHGELLIEFCPQGQRIAPALEVPGSCFENVCMPIPLRLLRLQGRMRFWGLKYKCNFAAEVCNKKWPLDPVTGTGLAEGWLGALAQIILLTFRVSHGFVEQLVSRKSSGFA